MKIFIMTDQEGVAGVLDSEHYSGIECPYYELAKELLTGEVNAAIDGFFAAGATEIMVADGHGNGSIHQLQLDRRVELLRGFPTGYPFSLDNSFDYIAWVGQHAMSRTEYAHLAHTGSMAKFEYTINGTAVGEFGQLAMCASELGVRAVFGSGDRAFCAEARALVPGIESVEVKRGITPGRGDECDAKQYGKRNAGAIHLHPERARRLIREGAERAVRRAQTEKFGIIPLKPPFEMVKQFRATSERPMTTIRGTHPTSVVALLKSIPVDPPAPASKK
ncbi:MAG: M55 family metallopeptidase [Kiritimatiellae bacterium]|nr:M55 family metallopeptidase [Kiritimatiellia bacterium]